MLPTSQTSPVPSQRCLIPINIETLAGSSFELLVSPYEQIQYIKRKIERREGIPISHQHLVWKSSELDDESCLHDYKIEAGTTIKLVLAMRGGPVNTKRVPIEDSFIRDVSEYIESSRDDYAINSDLLPSSNKNVTFLVLRDGDQFNFFQVIDRGDGTLSPLSGSMRYVTIEIRKYFFLFCTLLLVMLQCIMHMKQRLLNQNVNLMKNDKMMIVRQNKKWN
jgi:AN1-type zinc finger and ubiquitin domain-containing protein 1